MSEAIRGGAKTHSLCSTCLSQIHCVFKSVHSFILLHLAVPQGETSLSLSEMMDNMGMCDTDLRDHVSHSTHISDTQTLLKFFITALKKVSQSSATAASATSAHLLPTQLQESLVPEQMCDPADPTSHYDRSLRARHADNEQVSLDYMEVWKLLCTIHINYSFFFVCCCFERFIPRLSCYCLSKKFSYRGIFITMYNNLKMISTGTFLAETLCLKYSHLEFQISHLFSSLASQ